MAEGGMVKCSMVSVVEDVLQQHGKKFNLIDVASRKAQEAALRRNEAAAWLRKMLGVVARRDLPDQPSEEEFRLALRSGILLCNVLNKVQPGTLPKVVEAPDDSVAVPDSGALSVFQYFENVRNFRVSVEELGIPSFEASDLEQGGNSSRIVNCILALKSYCEWKQGGGTGLWKFGGNQKPSSAVKQFIRRNAGVFTKPIVRNTSADEKSVNSQLSEESTSGDAGTGSLTSLVHELLQDRKQEDIPIIIESMLSKLMEEFEHKITLQTDQSKTVSNSTAISDSVKSPIGIVPQLIVSNSNNNPAEIALHNEKGVAASKEEAVQTSKGVAASKDEAVQTSKRVAVSKDEAVEASKGVAASEDEAVQTSKGVAVSKDEAVEASKGVEATEAVETSKGVSASKEEAVETSSEGKLCNCKKPDPIALKIQFERRQMLTEKYQREIQELKNILDVVKGDVNVIKTQYQEEVSNLGNHLQTLTHAAKGYKKVLEENRKLYNVIQDLKGNIRVYCRVRPFMPGQDSSVTTVGDLDDGSITITSNLKNGKESRKTFTFSKVFGPSATQVEIFSDTQPLIRSVLDGYNVCIFAYGQTGAGKTHTMTGPNNITEETAGVNYRALGDLFLISEQRREVIAYEVSVQMIEIYNEQVRDLLATDGVIKRLEIRNNSQSGINVPDAHIVPVKSTSDVIALMNLGHNNRAVSSTSMNDRSSRSHSCLTVHVQGRDLTSGSRIRGCMHLVDLAGSERIEKSEVVGDALKEAVHINKSLSALGDVIASLAQKSTHVPYRNSKLTQLLQDSLGGQAKTLMFVHIAPEPHALSETLSTLKFAERVSSVELGAAKTNKDGSETKELKQQKSSLKAALARKDGDVLSEHGMDDAERWEEDNDELDTATATSDSSDPDFLLQNNIARPSSLPNLAGAGTKPKKPASKLSNGLDKKGSIPTPAKRRISNGISPLSQKTTKSPTSLEGKRKPIHGK